MGYGICSLADAILTLDNLRFKIANRMVEFRPPHQAIAVMLFCWDSLWARVVLQNLSITNSSPLYAVGTDHPLFVDWKSKCRLKSSLDLRIAQLTERYRTFVWYKRNIDSWYIAASEYKDVTWFRDWNSNCVIIHATASMDVQALVKESVIIDK